MKKELSKRHSSDKSVKEAINKPTITSIQEENPVTNGTTNPPKPSMKKELSKRYSNPDNKSLKEVPSKNSGPPIEEKKSNEPSPTGNVDTTKRRSGNFFDKFHSPNPSSSSKTGQSMRKEKNFASLKKRSTISTDQTAEAENGDLSKKETGGKIRPNLSHGNVFSMLGHSEKKHPEEKHGTKEDKQNSMRRAASFKEVWDAMSHFHLPHSHSAPKFEDSSEMDGRIIENGQLKNRKAKYKFLEIGAPLEFSQFEVIKQVGSGTFGRVYLCHHKVTSEAVVIKALEKRNIIKCGQSEHVMEEKQVLRILGQHECPFTVQALGSFQDRRMLYFVMEYISGGELFAHLDAARHHRFSEKRARYYISQLILALKYMHEKEHIVYRDIKPENMLLDKRGNLKIIDFGFAKQLLNEEKTYTFCGTPDYLSPEIIRGDGYNYEADLWSLGVFIYELVVGNAPFVTVDPQSKKVNYSAILAGQFSLPSHLSPAVKDLIISLLQVDRRYRLGAKNGLRDVMKHVWFTSIDWDGMLKKDIKPPKRHTFKKGLVNIQTKKFEPRPSEGLEEVDQSLFSHFNFNVDTDSDISEEDSQTGKPTVVSTRDTPSNSNRNYSHISMADHSQETVHSITTDDQQADNKGTKTTITFSVGDSSDENEEQEEQEEQENASEDKDKNKMFFI